MACGRSLELYKVEMCLLRHSVFSLAFDPANVVFDIATDTFES